MPAAASPEIDAYLAALPADQRAALQTLREQIRRAAPQAEECISYGIPAFRIGKTVVAGFKANKGWLSLHPFDNTTVAALADEVAGFETSKGTVRFTPDKPLPEPVVRKIVEAKLATS